MTKEEQQQCEETYLQKALGLLGHRLKVFDVKWYGGHPVAQVVYWDYKVSIITRAELQQLMPEVEFACGSKSHSSTRLPASCSADTRFTQVVVLPTPPF